MTLADVLKTPSTTPATASRCIRSTARLAAQRDASCKTRNADDYLPGGRAPQVGQIVRLPGLAATLQAIADGGAAAFYTGKIAEAIVARDAGSAAA